MQRFAQMKKMISSSDARIKEELRGPSKKKKPEDPHEIKVREVYVLKDICLNAINPTEKSLQSHV